MVKICPIMSTVVDNDTLDFSDPKSMPSYRLHEVACSSKCAWWDEDQQECIQKGEILRHREFQAKWKERQERYHKSQKGPDNA